MKTIKKLTALMLSLVMMLALGVTAFATESGNTNTGTTYTITAPDTNHQYEIYQIFTGDLSNGVLSNVKWGENAKNGENPIKVGESVPQEVLNALTVVNSKSDREKLNVIETYANLTSTPIGTVTNGVSYNAAAGYYLIKDKDGTVTGTDTYTTYIVKVVGDVNITPKSGVPSFEKKIKDTNDTTGQTSDWQDSADYDIGDAVPFKLEGTVSSKYADYKQYYFAFHDKEEQGLTFDPKSVNVYVDQSTTPIDASNYTVATEHLGDSCTFEIIFSNLKNIEAVKPGSKIRVEYTSTLNDNAVIGNQGNVNTAKLEFSNNPNEEQDGNKKPSTGETPWDNVIVFTYKVVINKYANSVGANNKLTGAEFTLEKVLNDGSKKAIAVVKSDNETCFTFNGLDDGNYILTETKTPATYNTIDPIKFTVTAEHKIKWEKEARTDILTSLSGNAEKGEITFSTIAKENEQSGIFGLSTDVINKSGSTLPSTGGMGTTIFYVVGTILVLAAVVLLITKKRMHADK